MGITSWASGEQLARYADAAASGAALDAVGTPR